VYGGFGASCEEEEEEAFFATVVVIGFSFSLPFPLGFLFVDLEYDDDMENVMMIVIVGS